MTISIQLYGTFILTVAGFVIPILTILISLFPDGIKSLSEKYENERKQSEDNIKNETAKKEKLKDLDYKTLGETIKALKDKKKEAELKLEYLKPKQFLLKTSIPFIISFVAVLISVLNLEIFYKITLLISSVVALFAGFLALFTSISVIFEVAEITNQKKISSEEKIISLLSNLVEKSGENPYLKPEEVKIGFAGNVIKKDLEISFSVNNKHAVPIYIHNASDKMAKNIEVVLSFPLNVVIDNTPNIEITTTEKDQIVRFKSEIVQANNRQLKGDINLTFLESGKIVIPFSFKGENIKYQGLSFTLNIVK